MFLGNVTSKTCYFRKSIGNGLTETIFMSSKLEVTMTSQKYILSEINHQDSRRVQEISPTNAESGSNMSSSNPKSSTLETKIRILAIKYNLPDSQCEYLIQERMSNVKIREISRRILANLFHSKPDEVLLKEIHENIRSIFSISAKQLDKYRKWYPSVEKNNIEIEAQVSGIVQDVKLTALDSDTNSAEAWEMRVQQFALKYNLPDYQCKYLIEVFKHGNQHKKAADGTFLPSDEIVRRIFANVFHLKPKKMLYIELHNEIKGIFGLSQTALNYYREWFPNVTEFYESDKGVACFDKKSIKLKREIDIQKFAEEYNVPDNQRQYLLDTKDHLKRSQATNKILGNVYYSMPKNKPVEDLYKSINAFTHISLLTLRKIKKMHPVQEIDEEIELAKADILTVAQQQLTLRKRKIKAIHKFAIEYNLPDIQRNYLIYAFTQLKKRKVTSTTHKILGNIYYSLSGSKHVKDLVKRINTFTLMSVFTLRRRRGKHSIDEITKEISESGASTNILVPLESASIELVDNLPPKPANPLKTCISSFVSHMPVKVEVSSLPISIERQETKIKEIKSFAQEYNLSDKQLKYMIYAYTKCKRIKATNTTYVILGQVYYCLPQNKSFKDLIKRIKSVFGNISGNLLRRHIKKVAPSEIDDDLNHAILFEDWKEIGLQKA